MRCLNVFRDIEHLITTPECNGSSFVVDPVKDQRFDFIHRLSFEFGSSFGYYCCGLSPLKAKTYLVSCFFLRQSEQEGSAVVVVDSHCNSFSDSPEGLLLL